MKGKNEKQVMSRIKNLRNRGPTYNAIRYYMEHERAPPSFEVEDNMRYMTPLTEKVKVRRNNQPWNSSLTCLPFLEQCRVLTANG